MNKFPAAAEKSTGKNTYLGVVRFVVFALTLMIGIWKLMGCCAMAFVFDALALSASVAGAPD